MDYHLGFYIHHHGSGHIMRAINIAKECDDKQITFLGSNLKPYQAIIPKRIRCIELPLDTPSEDEPIDEAYEQSRNFHYAPLNIEGIRKRNQLLVEFFASQYPMLFIVDTSPEIVALARLCGIPAIMVQQHGFRNDLAHQLAYDSAIKIIAPFPKEIATTNSDWVLQKTVYVGGFSKFSRTEAHSQSIDNLIGVMTGSGGTSINLEFACHLAHHAPNYVFKAIGNIDTDKKAVLNLPSNLRLTGLLDNPLKELEPCGLIIGNAGHNTVMEVASLNKRFICIPEERPFDEQIDKADKIKAQYGVKVVLPKDIFKIDWDDLLTAAKNTPLNWEGMNNPYALKEIRKELDDLAMKLF